MCSNIECIPTTNDEGSKISSTVAPTPPTAFNSTFRNEIFLHKFHNCHQKDRDFSDIISHLISVTEKLQARTSTTPHDPTIINHCTFSTHLMPFSFSGHVLTNSFSGHILATFSSVPLKTIEFVKS